MNCLQFTLPLSTPTGPRIPKKIHSAGCVIKRDQHILINLWKSLRWHKVPGHQSAWYGSSCILPLQKMPDKTHM